MQGWIVYNRETADSPFGNHAFDWMIKAAENVGLHARIIFEDEVVCSVEKNGLKLYIKGEEIAPPSFALMRTYAISLANQLDKKGSVVMNTALSMYLSQDKRLTHQCLSQNKIPMPNTMFLSGSRPFSFFEKTFGTPFVMKGALGRKGEFVYLISTEDELHYAIDQLKGKSCLFQEFISESVGTDIRVHVVGNKVVGAVRRRSVKGFRSNLCQGGQAEPVKLTEVQKEIAIHSALSLSLDCAGVDILESRRGPLVCEVNAIAGFRTLQNQKNVDIPQSIFKYIYNKMKK